MYELIASVLFLPFVVGIIVVGVIVIVLAITIIVENWFSLSDTLMSLAAVWAGVTLIFVGWMGVQLFAAPIINALR